MIMVVWMNFIMKNEGLTFLNKMSVIAAALMLSAGVANAASSVDLTVKGKINEGTCTLTLNNTAITLDEIDSSNTGLNDKTPTKPKDFTLSISDCSPGSASHKPALKFSGSRVNGLWRDAKTANADNDAGEAYGLVLNEKTTVLQCQNMNGKAILDGYCDLGNAGDLVADKDIDFSVGYGKAAGQGLNINTGGVKSSINIAFEYH